MKNITSFFKNINVKSVFITLLLLFNIHFSFSQVDLRTCGFDCTSNNYTLTDVYLSLSNVNGDPITNTTCTIGQVQQVYIYLNYSSNSNSSIHFARLNSDLTINGVTTFLNVLLGTIVPGSNKKLLYGPFNWTCGEELSLTNTIIAWKTNSNNDPGPNYQCGSFTNSQCDFTNSFIISKPLAVQFTYKACKVGANTTVTFTSTTNGGKTPYTYAWDFQNNGGLPDSTLPNPTYTYTTSNNTAKLTVTDSQNISNSYTLPIIEPAELMLSESHTNVGCSGGTSTITLTATGGTPAYTYLWNTGATTKDLQDVPPGTYTVTVTDSNSCTKQLSVTITSGDLIKPIIDPLPATSTINCPDLPVFTQATASDNSGTVTSLTYEDVNTPGSCTGTYSITRTWTAKDACNNISLPVSQTINVVDTTAPIWTTLATSLDVTLECSDIAGLATAQNQAPIAADNCSTVTYTKTSGNFIAGSCANSGTYTNTWVAQDACLNSSTTFTQIITIQDTSVPIWTTTSNALNVTLQCSDVIGISNAQNQAPVATDNCGGTVTYTKTSGIFVAGSCVNSGTYTNTWVANDVCLNTSTTFTQVITIIDNTAPIWTTASNALNETLQCSDTAGLSTAQNQAPVATDNCGGTVTYTKTSGIFVAGSCVNSGTYTNTWVANDVCLNTSTTFTQVITIIDNTVPIWTTASNALNVTLQCSDTVGLSTAQNQAPVATDNCGGTVTYTKTSGIFVASSCVNSGTYTNTWVANDVCLNTSTTFTQVITIIDNTAPTWTTASNALNVTLQCSDAAGISNAQNQAPVATDNCGGTVTYTKTSGIFVAGSCVNSGTYTNTWVANDVCLNTSTTFTQVITIIDNTAPTWTTASNALNVTLQCSDTVGLSTAQNQAPVATDNCGGTVTYTKTSGIFVASSCVNSGTYTNTWVANDVCLNTSTTFTQVITIEDTTKPTWTTQTASLDLTLECSDLSALASAQALFPTASDLCDADVLNVVKISGQFTASGSCSNAGTYTNTWTVTDDCGNISDTFTQVITIQDTTKPTWTTQTASLDTTLECSDLTALASAQALFPTASDLCDADVLNVVKISGQFVASGSCSNAGTYTNTWTVTDDCGNVSDTFTQVITIQDTTKPTWTTQTASLDTTLECSDLTALASAQALFPTASDLCDADVLNVVKISGQFVASGSCSNAGTYTNTWTVTDDCGNVSDTFTQVITIEDTTKPTWTTQTASLDATLECSDLTALASAQALFPTASDLCDADVLNVVKISGQFVASGSCSNAGTYTNTWTVTDDCGNVSDIFFQVITIEDTTKPTWTTTANELDLTLECSDLSALASAQALFPTASDLCDADVLNVVKTSGQFVASGSCSNAGTYTNTWTVTDDCGNISDTFTQVITIQDTTKPTWTTTANELDLTLECSDLTALASAQALFPTASDLCDADVLNIVKISGQFIASGSCSNTGTYTNTWTVTDDCGNVSDIFFQVITIEDTTKPTWTTTANELDLTLECSDLSALASAQALFPTASDLCDADVLNVVKTSGQFVASGSCSNAGTYTNTWIVTDDCGNVSDTFTQVITIQDTTKPTWTTQTASLDATLECSDLTALASAQALFPTASDLCDADVLNIVKISGQFVASGSCSNAGTYTNTWTVTDDCGNVSDIFFQVITIEDTTKPTWTTTANELDLTLECSDLSALASAQALFPTASDLCDADVSNVVKISGQFVASGSCSNAGTYTNTWTVTDDCGNVSDTFTQVITIQDTTKPTWTTQTASLDATLECSDLSALASAQALFPTASDLCDADVLNIVKISGQFVASGSCSNAGTYTNTWTVTDDCGNVSDTFTQVITIEDTTKPTWTTQTASLDATLECSDLSALASAQALFPTASDLCDADVLNIVKISGQFVASGSCSNAGTYTNTWTVTDDCGNVSDTFTQVITIEDTTKPIFSGDLPTNITVSCDAVPEPAEMNVADNCNLGLPVVFSEIKSDIQNECASNYTLTRQWTTSDCAGNTTSFTQIITVRDTTPPTGTAPADVAGLQSITDIPLANSQDIIDAADNCSQNVTITINDTNNGASGCEGNAYILTRTYTLMDCAGNKTDLVQTFTVENKISVSGIASAVTCFGGDNGSILVTNTAGSTVVITNEENEIVENSNLPAGTYTLTASFPVNENQTCSATATVIITQPSSPNEVTTISSEACADDSSLINLLTLLPINTTATGNWIDKNNSNALQGNIFNPFGLALGNYLLEYQITDEICPRSILLNMEINNDCQVLACGNVVIHNAFSPNGDGINDAFKIDSIDDLTCYPENTVEIYNRWGILVFETVNYNNTTNAFDGTSRGRTTVKQSEGLPTGTYFYIINYKSLDGNNIIQSNKKDGFLYLSK
ncbi:Ig-like domain-containing protein [Flavobacterium pectinovorum]|uniref:HYR-like domain-containing protein n=1 Tax=Flavobacterium pectinovorum TaxID=29533 RepID=UPI00265ED940|nr:Ig-like domain-containing protein [Flavobacterium pectinovorum]WKL49842.1 Ig-like domain-containing protein [Flavobacterium pectinovorum]